MDHVDDLVLDDAFAAGLEAGERGDAPGINPYRGPASWQAWECGYSAGLFNREHAPHGAERGE